MELPKLENERRALVERAKAVIDAGDITESEEAELTDLKARVEALDGRIATVKTIRAWDVSQAKAPDRADAVQARRRADFSILKAIRAAWGRSLPEDDLGFEEEVQAELRRDRLHGYEGIPVPLEALSTRLPSSAAAASGFQAQAELIADVHRPDMYLDALRDRIVAGQLGVTVLSGLSAGNLDIPAADASNLAAVAWATETGAFTETVPQFATVSIGPPHKLGAWAEWSQQLVLQSAPGIEGLVRGQLVDAVAAALDETIIYGAATNGPTGGVTASITNTARAADTNGKALTFAELDALQLLLDTRNVPADGRAWLLAPRTRNALRNVPRFATDGDRGAELAFQNGGILGERAVVTNGVSTAVTHGSSAVTSSLFYGRWSDLVVAYWQGLDIMLNPYADTSFKRGSILIRAMLFMDTQILRDDSFAYYDAVI